MNINNSWGSFLLKEKDANYSKERTIQMLYFYHEYSHGHAQVPTQPQLGSPSPNPGPAVGSWKGQRGRQWVTHPGENPVIDYGQQTVMCPLNSKTKLQGEKERALPGLSTVCRDRLPAYVATAAFSASLTVCSPASPSEALKPLMKRTSLIFSFYCWCKTNCSVW